MELNVRQSWDQISLAEYMQYRSILKDESKSAFEKSLETVALLAKVSPKWLLKVPPHQIGQLFKTLDFLAEEPMGPVLQEYELDERKYRLAYKIDDITSGQFIDLTHYCKDQTSDAILQAAPNIIATVLIPYKELGYQDENVGVRVKRSLIEDYLDTPREETVEAIMQMPVTEALSISAFFTVLLFGFLRAIRPSSTTQ